MLCLNNLVIEVGARASPLSKIQAYEVLEELKIHYSFIKFSFHFLDTIGDLDKTTSLRTLDRTDFFTKEIDEWTLSKANRIGIHSAKDLPFPLAPGLIIFCLTYGVDSSDSLVIQDHQTIHTLPFQALIATSSERREQAVSQIRPDLNFCDIRGTIAERLKKLEDGLVDGVVIAEAALIRLKLTHLNRIKLPGSTLEGQGQLAVVGRIKDKELKDIFSCLDTR